MKEPFDWDHAFEETAHDEYLDKLEALIRAVYDKDFVAGLPDTRHGREAKERADQNRFYAPEALKE